MYEVQEQSILQHQIENGFRLQENKSNYMVTAETTTNIFDSSNIHFVDPARLNSYPGFCVDIGAPRSVVGRDQLNTFLRSPGKRQIPRISSSSSFRFGDVTVKSLGMVELELSTPDGITSIRVLMEIVPVNLPPLLGLNFSMENNFMQTM